MGLDYYALLDVQRTARIWEIKLAYRKLAWRLHPLRKVYQQHPNPRPEGVFDLPLPSLPENVYWEFLNEAYDVLSNELRREVYNQYGEEGLKRGVAAPNGVIQPYCYHNDYMRTYFEVFGSYSPYADLIDAATNPPPLYKVKQGLGVIHKNADIKHILRLSLEELYFGCTKIFKYTRMEFVDDLKIELEKREVSIHIPVQAGCLDGTKITFPEAGDQSVIQKPSDFIFIVNTAPHKVFTRNQSDLHMKYSITLKQALVGFKMSIETIDKRKLRFFVTDVVGCGYEKCIEREGLIHPENSCRRGNLYIHFKIQFPKLIPNYLRVKVEEIFDEIEENEKLMVERQCLNFTPIN